MTAKRERYETGFKSSPYKYFQEQEDKRKELEKNQENQEIQETQENQVNQENQENDETVDDDDEVIVIPYILTRWSAPILNTLMNLLFECSEQASHFNNTIWNTLMHVLAASQGEQPQGTQGHMQRLPSQMLV